MNNRIGYSDITVLTAKVAADRELARQGNPGSVKCDAPSRGTEKSFRH